MDCIKLGTLITALAAASCATMNPYVQHNRNVSSANIAACKAVTNQDEALDYACRMVIRIEKSRSEIVSTRSGLTATVFPLAGIIGYNSARGINAPTNTAMTAGGFAGYSAITTLAQPDRIRVYDNGLRSIYCAIDVYQTGAASAAPESAERMILGFEISRTRNLLKKYRVKIASDAASINEIERAQSIVDGIEQWVSKSNPTRGQQSQLLGFVRTIIGKLNSQLTLTVPDNKQLIGDALGTLQATTAPTPTNAAALKAMAPAPVSISTSSIAKNLSITDNDKVAIESALSGLIGLYERLAVDTPTNSAQLNFNDCAYTDIADIGTKDTIGRFMLGPGDAYHGATVGVIRGATFTANISGGVLPYSATVATSSGADAITATIDPKLGVLTVSVPAPNSTPAAQASYRIIVNDATNRYAKWMQVNVPASP